MPREYTFRGKQFDSGRWCVGNLLINDNVAKIKPRYTNTNSDIIVDPHTVGQYTGYVDKNSNKIFEGDIVKTKNGRLCIVTWFQSNLQACWDLKVINTRANIKHERPPEYDLWLYENLEIVGNIYDNPELLKD